MLDLQVPSISDADPDAAVESLKTTRSALAMHAMLMSWILQMADEAAAEAAKEPVKQKPKGKANARANHLIEAWDWETQREKMLRGLAGCLAIDLRRLWAGQVPESLVNRICGTAWKTLEQTTISLVKSKHLREACLSILIAAVNRANHRTAAANHVVNMLLKYEHLPSTLAELMDGVVRHGGVEGGRLVSDVIREVGNVDSRELARDTGGAKNINVFLADVAERLPQALIPNPHGHTHARLISRARLQLWVSCEF